MLDRELRGIARQIDEANDRSQALQAEWAWLNEPERLRGVAQRHLQLEPMQPTQFLRLNEAERRLPQVAAYEGPKALFAERLPVAPEGAVVLALLPRVSDPVQVAHGVKPPPAPLAPVAAPLVAPIAPPVAEAPPLPRSRCRCRCPRRRRSRPRRPPRKPVPARRRSSPPGRPSRCASTCASRRRAPPSRSQPRPSRPASPAGPPGRHPPGATPGARGRRAAADRRAHAPGHAAAGRAYGAAAADVASRHHPGRLPGRRRAAPRMAEAPVIALGSALGGGRPLLAPPVPFGSANAATLGGAAVNRDFEFEELRPPPSRMRRRPAGRCPPAACPMAARPRAPWCGSAAPNSPAATSWRRRAAGC
ncbi:hypothetical protein [Dankookia sp. P2]|uniref:hypothetical protein n=1 Tax=Dankookia sp. P2 TaxID=3423955 RepID=UPI003D67D6F9